MSSLAPTPQSEFQTRDLLLKEKDYRLKCADFGLKLFAALAALIMLYITINKHLSELEASRLQRQQNEAKQEADRKTALELQEREITQREKDYKLKFYDRRLELYLELCDTMGRIGEAPDLSDDTTRRDIQRFYQLLFGKTILIAESSVFDEAQKLAALLVRPPTSDDAHRGLRRQVLDVNLACRKSLQQEFPEIGKVSADEMLRGTKFAFPEKHKK